MLNIKEEFIKENMMGPNSMIIIDELLKNQNLKTGIKVLDLGCGKGLTSIYLAKKHKVQVYAVDLWISATENYNRFKELGVDDLIIPIHADALNLPFAENYFDAVVSVDSYHYFGNNDTYFEKYLKQFLKKDGLVAIAFPGMKFEVHKNILKEMKELWEEENLDCWHSIDWWKEKIGKHLKNPIFDEMKCFDDAWKCWLSCENLYALEDKKMIETDNGRYMNLISIIGKVSK